MKYVIIGGVAGGASFACRLRRLDENCQIVIYEKSNYVSYANCGLPYYLSGVINNKKYLTLQSPRSLKNRFNIDVFVNNEVISIDKENKILTIKDLTNNKIYQDNYDKLILSPGSEAIKIVDQIDVYSLKILTIVFLIYYIKLFRSNADALLVDMNKYCEQILPEEYPNTQEWVNHLDMLTKQELIDALNSYNGTLLVVSHDRYFVDSICNRLIYFEDGQAYLYQGRYSDFKLDVLDPLLLKKDEALNINRKDVKSKNKNILTNNIDKTKKKPKLAKNKIEEKLASLENKISEVKHLMELEENYKDFNKMHELEAKQKELEDNYNELFEMLALYEE